MKRQIKRANPLFFFHCIPLERVRHGVFFPDRKFSDEEFRPEYEWLAAEVGFYPIFLAVGNDIDDRAAQLSGYSDQWLTNLGGEILADGSNKDLRRRAGEFPNYVLFAFELDKVSGLRLYNDYLAWHTVMMQHCNSGCVKESARKALFKRSWNEAKWLRKAALDGKNVQAVVPNLNLDDAFVAYVRNEKTRHDLLTRGFKNVVVKRVSTRELRPAVSE
jgi:hypothetical protein